MAESKKTSSTSNKSRPSTEACCVVDCDQPPTRKCDRCDRPGCETHVIEKVITLQQNENWSESIKAFRCPVCEALVQDIEKRAKAREHKIAVTIGLILLVLFLGAALLDYLGIGR